MCPVLFSFNTVCLQKTSQRCVDVIKRAARLEKSQIFFYCALL